MSRVSASLRVTILMVILLAHQLRAEDWALTVRHNEYDAIVRAETEQKGGFLTVRGTVRDAFPSAHIQGAHLLLQFKDTLGILVAEKPVVLATPSPRLDIRTNNRRPFLVRVPLSEIGEARHIEISYDRNPYRTEVRRALLPEVTPQ